VITNTRTVTDTLILTTTDTAIIVQPDASTLSALIECDSLGRAYIKEIISLSAGRVVSVPQDRFVDRVLTVDCKVDSFAVYAQIKNKYHRVESVEKSTTFVKPKPPFNLYLLLLTIIFLSLVVFKYLRR
jgi:hypothetical protein